MSRMTSMGLEPGPRRIKIHETVYGEGPDTAGAEQNLIDRMERRIAEIREELVRKREGRL